MHRYLEAILGFPRKTWRALSAEASVLREFLADVRGFASERWRTRKRATLPAPGSLEKSLDQIILDAASSITDAKKKVAVAIAAGLVLAKHTEQEEEIIKEWTRRAERAEKEGDAALVREARSRAREHAELAAGYRAQHTRQVGAIDKLTSTLRTLHGRKELAKSNKGLIMSAYKEASRNEHAQTTREEMEATIRILDRLSGLAARARKKDEDTDDD